MHPPATVAHGSFVGVGESKGWGAVLEAVVPEFEEESVAGCVCGWEGGVDGDSVEGEAVESGVVAGSSGAGDHPVDCEVPRVGWEEKAARLVDGRTGAWLAGGAIDAGESVVEEFSLPRDVLGVGHVADDLKGPGDVLVDLGGAVGEAEEVVRVNGACTAEDGGLEEGFTLGWVEVKVQRHARDEGGEEEHYDRVVDFARNPHVSPPS